MSTFSDLKKSSATSFAKLNDELAKLNKPAFQNESTDERFWRPTVDKAGTGRAVIRFLPAPAGEDVPFVRVWEHGFEGPGGWYIEKSLTTLGQPDPVAEYNSALWATNIEDNRKLVKEKTKRRLHYYSNIYVVSDPGNPANEGKVFLFKYGKKIFDKLNDLMHPEFEGETPINPFDLWTGCTFDLKIRKVEGFRNYDKSEFQKPGPLLEDDAALEAIWKSEHSLQAMVDPAIFKSYDELKKRLNVVMQLQKTARAIAADEGEDIRVESAPAKAEGDDEGMDYFRRLADEN